MIAIKSSHISEMEKHYSISLINSLIGYKSFNLLATISNDGVTNLSLFGVSSGFEAFTIGRSDQA